jgi:NAD+ synthase (glutamine-hydrolysing)
LRCQEVFELQILALKRRLRHTGLKTMVLGLSGGLDSTLAALVCARVAADAQYQFRVMAISMPGFGTSDRTRKNAMALAKSLGISCTEIDITSACEQHFRDIGHDGKTADITFENVQARERTQILMDIANKNSGLVIGTSDLSEIALGWSTFGGDHLSMYAVNCSVPKTLLRYVIAWVADKDGSSLRSILVDILATPVSPELIPTHSSSDIVQKTEDIIGPYRVHDFFMYHFLRYGCEPKRLLFLANQAFAGEYSDVQLKAQLKVFLQRFFQNQFKRSCTPDGPKIGTIALSPRGDWRMPSDASAKAWLDQLQ